MGPVSNTTPHPLLVLVALSPIIPVACVTSAPTPSHPPNLNLSVLGAGAVPFVLAASLGTAAGMWGYYSYCLTQAIIVLDRYPHLMRLHLDANFPVYWRRKSDVRDIVGKGWVENSMLVTAWQSAGTALEVCDFL